MKKILHSILLLLCVFQCVYINAAVNPKDIIKKGTKIVYDVNYFGSTYQFIITVNTINDNDFDWEMSAPINKNGNLIISDNAIKNADRLYNYFTNGKVKLDSQTCIRMSEKMFDEFKNKKSMKICIDKSNTTFTNFGNPYQHSQTFGYNNNYSKEFDCITVSDKNGYEITYVNNADFPLIIEMKLDWSIRLNEIIN